MKRKPPTRRRRRCAPKYQRISKRSRLRDQRDYRRLMRCWLLRECCKQVRRWRDEQARAVAAWEKKGRRGEAPQWSWPLEVRQLVFQSGYRG